MSSGDNIAVVEAAVEICNNPELKREILCVPGSDYDINKDNYLFDRKKQWDEIVEKKATVILKNLDIQENIQEKVMGIVFLIGMRMLTWAKYHEDALGLSNEYSVNFLNSSHFTQQGIINNKKVAEELMKDESLSIKVKYKLACLYCVKKHIPALYRQMKTKDKEIFYNNKDSNIIKQPGLAKFWSYYLMGEIDKLQGEKSLDQYRLEKFVKSGNKEAVEYCLEYTNLRIKKGAVVDAAVEAVKNMVKRDDWFVFRDRCDKRKKFWIPHDYYVDILYYLIFKMKEDQQIEFFKIDIEAFKYERECFEDHKRSRVLECFLNWPYQDNFLKKAELMWEFLPVRSYAVLLLKICDKIESIEGTLKYGEEKSYDYRRLLKDFWNQSPERYKKYVFRNQEIVYVTNRVVEIKTGIGLLIKLLTLKNLSCADREIIKLILSNATDKEKENIFSSKECQNIFIELIKDEKWERLERSTLTCFSSKEEVDKFKRKLSVTKEAQYICIDFVKNDNWNAAKSFIEWSTLPEEKLNKLKKDIIYSENGRDACMNLISYDKKIKPVSKFIKWCLPTEEETKAFKKKYIFSCQGICKCLNLLIKDELELVNEFINFCLPSEGEVRELKKNIAFRTGSSVCEQIILDKWIEAINDEQGNTIIHEIKFKEDRWVMVEKFLTWCFSSEAEMNEFKKRLLKVSGKNIHFNLINSNKWEEAETFFDWLELSNEEIKELKKETLINCDEASVMFSEIMHSKEGNKEFMNFGNKQEAVELLLRWYLTDKESVLEFKNIFKSGYEEVTEEDEAVLKNFDLVIEQHLRDLDKDKMGVKRKSEALSPNKKICKLKLENRGTEYDKETD